VSPGVFSIDDPEAIPIIYTTSNAWKKSRWYYAAGLPDETKYNSFATDNEKVNGEMRRKMKPVLDQYIIYEEHIDTCIKILTERLQERSGTGEVVDLGWWMTCYTFDVAGMMTVRICWICSSYSQFLMCILVLRKIWAPRQRRRRQQGCAVH
jgi:hypothetical protein